MNWGGADKRVCRGGVLKSEMLSEKKRIAINVFVTYLRSLIAVVCGVFTGRWILMSLGENDFGLYGVVGGLIMFLSFISWPINSAVVRFYAYAVGQELKHGNDGGDECRQWFNVSFSLLTVIPLLLLAIGYPIGEYAVRHWLTIPSDRLPSCVWVFRFACITGFFSMVKIPFYSMFTAKQNIAELTLCSLLETVLHICLVYYMVSHPGDWLARYALWHCLANLAVTVLTCSLAIILFPECRLVLPYLYIRDKMKRLCNYSGWMFFGCIGALLRGQGIAVLVNKIYSPAANASLSIANTISNQTNTLSASITGSFAPAITNACGAGEYEKMRNYVYLSCKLGTFCVLVFALPLMLELKYVLTLWLKNPPEYVVGLAYCVLISLIVDRLNSGYATAITAFGRIASYQSVTGSFVILALPLAWLFTKLFSEVYSIGYALIVSNVLCSLSAVYFAQRFATMSMLAWVTRIVLPFFFISTLAVIVGGIFTWQMRPSLCRLLLVFVTTDTVLCCLSFFILMNRSERDVLVQRLKHLIHPY